VVGGDVDRVGRGVETLGRTWFGEDGARRAFVEAVLLFGLAAWTVIEQVPTVHQIGDWFWELHVTPLTVAPVLGMLVALGVGVLLIASRPRPVVGGMLAMCLALGAQWTMGLAEGRGEAGLRDRAIHTGHAEFVQVAAATSDVWPILYDYEARYSMPPYEYLQSKPPGQLLSYVLLSRLADVVVPSGMQRQDPVLGLHTDSERRLVELMTLLLPAFAALAAPLLVAFAWRLGVRATAVAAGLSMAFTAPFVLIQLHFDQAVYPSLALLTWLTAALSGEPGRRGVVFGVLTGLLLWLCLYVSFSLMGLVPLLVVCAWMGSQGAARRERWMSTGGSLVRMLAAFLAMALLTRMALGYDMVGRYQAAMAHHLAWKGYQGGLEQMLTTARLDLVEFLWWIGPASGPILVAMGSGAVQLVRGRADASDVFAVTLGATLVGLSLLGHTIAEVARLWLFLVPAVLLVAAHALHRHDTARGRAWTAALAVAQGVWTIVLKGWQDFY